MRPLRLTMQAFGPYPDRQTVDFTEALKIGLFGLYGPTGAGKSSIFSAISFALFGAAAKGEQDHATLRSHHATPDTATEVQLVFDVGPKRYFVRRRPEQARPKLRGGGETKEAHSASLFDATGMALDDISDTNPGKVLAEKKVGEVAQHMQMVLGYSAEHFRQIVLLPQGEFERFLVAKTEDRLKILRQLFDVSLFQKLAKKLRDDASRAASAISNDRRVLSRLLEDEACVSLEALKASADQAQADAGTLRPVLVAAGAAAQLAATKLGEARELNKRFDDLTAAAAAVSKLEAADTDIDASRIALRGARLAQGLADADQAVAAARRRLTAAETASGQADNRNARAKDAAAEATRVLEVEQAREAERAAAVAQRADLQRFGRVLQSSEGQRDVVATAQTAADTATAALTRAQTAHEALVHAKRAKSQDLANAEQNAEARAGLTTQVQAKDQAHREAKQVEAASKALAEAVAAEKRAQRAADIAEVTADEAENTFLAAEQHLSQVQAIHLAEKLVDGEPCPVCGAHDHPAPAEGDASSAGRNDAFLAAKENRDAARKAHGEAREALAATKTLAETRKDALNALPSPAAPAVQLAAELKALKDSLAALGPEVNIPAIKEAIRNADEQIETAASAVDAARQADGVAKTKLARAQQGLETALQEVPENLRDADALAAAVGATDQHVAQLQAALAAAVSGERTAGEAAVAAAAELLSAQQAVVAAGEDLTRDVAAFGERLVAAGLDETEYRAHKANIGRIDALEQRIQAHDQSVAAAKAGLVQAQQRIDGVERPDLQALQTDHDACEQARNEAATKEADARGKAARLAGLHVKLTGDHERIAKAEEAYKPLGAVAAVLTGENSQRVDIEAFAMAAMFDRVLEHANLRLGPMTGGRYALQRGYEGKGGGRRGLDVVVNDLFTGKPRPPSTLSGGETFQAALALALGLSDVVESLNGGICLDMIFIDEGFGSLDGQTLDEALQTLQDLVGQSRALGLISHIDAVQQAIPHGFQIEKTMTGSIIRPRRPT